MVVVRKGVAAIRMQVVAVHMLEFNRMVVEAICMMVAVDHKLLARLVHIHQFYHHHRNRRERLMAIHIDLGMQVQEELHSLVLILEGKLAVVLILEGKLVVVQMVDHRHRWL